MGASKEVNHKGGCGVVYAAVSALRCVLSANALN